MYYNIKLCRCQLSTPPRYRYVKHKW